MNSIFIKYTLVVILCICSWSAHQYLNTISANSKKMAQTTNSKKIYITDSKTNKTHVIVIEEKKDSSKTTKKNSKNKDSQGLLPDVEFLKFIIKKGKEGIPVLSIGNFLSGKESTNHDDELE
ncbi:MAG: hypothetical protein MK212_04095 [Saprospiraceae bacterium]|nr:hypothetical protein [Saprospiraceae bacterium]